MKKCSIFRFIKNKYFIVLVVILVIVIGYYVTHKKSAATFDSVTASTGDVIEKVSVTGTVSPIDKASLSFQKSGVISKIFVKVGDNINAGDPIALLDNTADAASVAGAQATLDDMSRSLTPEELKVQQDALVTAKQNALNAVHDGYTKAQSSLVNYTDSFFTNPQTVNPSITIRTDSSSIQNSINNERVLVSDTLNKWATKLPSIDVNSVPTFINDTNSYLATVKTFMNDLSVIVGKLSPGNSGLSQTQIDSYSTIMNTALSTLNSAIDTVTSAATALASAQSNYDLKLAGNSSESISAQKAKVAQAQAVLSQDTLLSPIDGIVTQEDPNVGEYTGPGQAGFAVQNSGFKIEAFVPEADIAKIAVGDLSSSTLDAYGSYVDFPAKVVSIDPAETVLEGVPTYKVSLQFVTPDPRIRSGMTVNLDILTHAVMGVIEIPYRALTINATSTTVKIVSNDGKTYSSIPVTVGLKGSDGTIEIKSGLNVGDKVVTYIK